MSTQTDEQHLKAEIARLESLLEAARRQPNFSTNSPSAEKSPCATPHVRVSSHALLLLSDSALPLGSFAFSSGLESYLAHTESPTLPPFLALSLLSVATTSLPYLLTAHRTPSALRDLDTTLDACNLCPVARRASVAQGRALLTVWERAFRSTVTEKDSDAALVLEEFAAAMKMRQQDGSEAIEGLTAPNAHFIPIWAVVTRAMNISVHQAAYVFFFNHAKAIVSAAVRASVMGPYQAQRLLASEWLRGEIEKVMEGNWEVAVEDAGQGVPMTDFWVGRHELLYSRIFNS